MSDCRTNDVMGGPYLGGDGVTSRWEEFGDAGSAETSFCKAEGSSQTCSSCAAIVVLVCANLTREKIRLTQREHHTHAQSEDTFPMPRTK